MNKTGMLSALLTVFALCFFAVTAVITPDAKGETFLECADMEKTETPIELSIDGVVLPVQWEQNEAVDALVALLKQGDVTVQTQRYGGFEQVGALPASLPSDDTQLTAMPGDIMLYADDQIVFFFGSNSWTYTRLGYIDSMTDEELASLLGAENAVVTLSWADEKSEPGN